MYHIENNLIKFGLIVRLSFSYYIMLPNTLSFLYNAAKQDIIATMHITRLKDCRSNETLMKLLTME